MSRPVRCRVRALRFLAAHPLVFLALLATGLCAGLPPALLVIYGFDDFGAWRFGFVVPIVAVLLGLVGGNALGGAVTVAAFRAAIGGPPSPADMARGAWRRFTYMRLMPSGNWNGQEIYDLVPDNIKVAARPGYRELEPPYWLWSSWAEGLGRLAATAYLPVVLIVMRRMDYTPPSIGWGFFLIAGFPVAFVLGFGQAWASFNDVYEGVRAAARFAPERLPALLEVFGIRPDEYDYDA